MCSKFQFNFLESSVCNSLTKVCNIQNFVVQDFFVCYFFLFVAVKSTYVKIDESIFMDINCDKLPDTPFALQVLFVCKSKIKLQNVIVRNHSKSVYENF